MRLPYIKAPIVPKQLLSLTVALKHSDTLIFHLYNMNPEPKLGNLIEPCHPQSLGRRVGHADSLDRPFPNLDQF